MKNRFFWKFGSVNLLLLLLVTAAVDTYVVQALRRAYLETALGQLESLTRLAQSRPPESADRPALQEWALWMARTGVRATLIAPDGTVLADSSEDPLKMENHTGRPEIGAALKTGSGRAVRYSATLGHDLVYLAIRQDTQSGMPLVIRFAVPLEQLDEALMRFRRGLWTASIAILLLAAAASLLLFRSFSTRIERLKEFSRRVAAGDFKLLPEDRRGDALSELSATLNQTAAQLDGTIRTLTAERNQSAAVLASMAEGVVVTGHNQRVAFCNAAFCRALGIENKTWEGHPVVEVIPNADLLGYIDRAQERNAAVTGELVVGSVKTKSFAVTVTPVRANGKTGGSVMVLHDISELRRLERARSDFVANISHEYKTPLTAIQGFAETLLGGALEDKENSRRFLEIIRDNVTRLGRLTEDLLKLARIEAGKLQPQFQPVDIGAVIGSSIETMRLSAAQKNLVLEADCRPDLPPVSGDAGWLQQVLQNLLDNAVRYSPAGERILVKAAAQGSRVVVSVADRGPGIPKAEQDRIFERFYRADSARSRESGGTGLGLSIAKHLVEAHKGTIKVESEVGVGSTFYVFLPTG